MEDLFSIADRFQRAGEIVDIREYGNGNVNDTFLVTLDSGPENHFILQRINSRVFQRPELVMRNMRIVAEHVRERLRRCPPAEGRRWEVVRVLATKDGGDHWRDREASCWRAITFIGGAQSFDFLEDLGQAGEVGYALGMFHNLISDLPPERLADTLEGFHVTPRYLHRYDEIVARSPVRRSPEVDFGLRFVAERREWANVLEEAKARGKLRLRPIHGDPKANNVMMDAVTRRAIGIVDLDTVKPGLVHYDIGDCLRSCCNLLGEETERWETVEFQPDFCRAILRGYLSEAGGFLTENDHEHLFHAIRLIPFELGLRFFTDYLEGNVYFKVNRTEHNLSRALVQWKLTGSIESRRHEIRSILRDLR